ncbi:c-type cytochrome [Dyadobacter psychrotolerans]|uniref:C-type cytochrome n=1 Tax=Dyadobacter psychrotolerans TaxID=2541721 RepID=A0A4R5DX71_9BACT|nr:c-type cytochrome [Dyadobacter psychrotolerans]TDE17244.1 c-type cytochrome [Dyadobacter psychrotolerans]
MEKLLKIAGILLLIIVIIAAACGFYVKTMLPDVGPAQNFSLDRSDKRIQRGKYLANHVAVCMDCHSTRSQELFAGPLVAGNFGGGGEKFNKDMGFPGNFYSRNITPYALGSWTDGEIFRAITTGVSKDGHALFPVMPYHAYGKLDQEDLYSIIAYVRTLPAVKNDVPASEADFPVSLLINTMPVSASLSVRPKDTDILARGGYLVTAAACVECHSKMEKGAKVPGTEFGGGMEFGLPGGTVRSANITPDKTTGIGNWSEADFVKRFKLYADSAYVPHKVGPNDMNTPMPWTMYAGMEEDDLKAIFAYLKSLKPISHQVTKFSQN